ncbi:MAG: hypothetical protein WC670_16875 [Pseudolabrys sp.]|jgi:hypothetical protein
MAKKSKSAKKAAKKIRRRPWTNEEYKKLKSHSKARTPVSKIAKEFKRTPGALRQQALKLGIGLGHQR